MNQPPPTDRPPPDAIAWLQLLDVWPTDLPNEHIVDELENMGAPAAELAPAIAKRLEQAQSELVAYWAVTLLGRLGPAAINQLSQLCQALAHSPHLPVRERAAWALGQLGPLAHDALTVLEEAANSDHPRLARLAQASIVQIDPSQR